MKKIFCFVSAVTILVMLTACGGGGSSVPMQESTPSIEDTVTPEPTLQHSLEEVMADVLFYAESEGMEVSNETNTKIKEMYDAGNDDSLDIFMFLCDNGWLTYISLSTENLCDQVFYTISPFSEERAWVQYRDDTQELVTSVINTAGEIVFTPEQKVISFLPYNDGYAVYLYAVDPTQNSSSDNVRSCIVDTDGNITYDSSTDGCRFIFAYGNGNFLALEHISNFEKDEWSFGSIDKDGKTLALFEKCDNFNGYPANLVSECKYLDEDIFLLGNAIYSLKSKSAVYYVNPKFGDAPMDFVKGAFHDGHALVYVQALLEDGIANITSAGERTILFKETYSFNNKLSDYEDGLFFYGNHYCDIDGNTKITFPQYEGKYFKGGTFHDGFAPLHIKGADGLDYFTIINLEGDTVIEPTPGLPADKFSEGYLVVQTESGCALYGTDGKKISEFSYNVLGAIGGSSTEVKNGYFVAYSKGSEQPIFVGVDGGQIGQ